MRRALHDFDAPPIDEALERLTRALAHGGQAAMRPASTSGMRDLLNTLVTRLRANAWFHRHPEILDEQLPPPVVILGLARTGTTLLHRLLASDPRIYSAAWWECRFPVPADDDVSGEQRSGRGDGRGGRDSRGAARARGDPSVGCARRRRRHHADGPDAAQHDGRVARVHPELSRLDPPAGPASVVPLPAQAHALPAMAEDAARRAARGALGAQDADAPRATST